MGQPTTTSRVKEKSLPSMQEAFARVDSSKQGLTSLEAAKRRERYGSNSFSGNKISAFIIVLNQFHSSLAYLLVCASGLSFLLKDYSDGIVIAAILFINASLGFFQEYKSEKTVEKLAKLVAHHVLARRDGKMTLIPHLQLVPGDVVMVKEGDIVPADLLLLESEDLQADESQLSGESLPVAKVARLGHNTQAQQLFSGSVVEKGEGLGLVIKIGNRTQLGKIAQLSSSTKKVTQYEKSLQIFSAFLIKITLFILALVLVSKLTLAHSITDVTSYLIFIIALAIAVVPEAMPVIATVTLASGALRLSKQHVVVKKLTAMEDLGNITVLCTDKTGTLTQNKLTITQVVSEEALLLQAFAIACMDSLDEKRKHLASSFDQAFGDYVNKEAKNEADFFKKLQELPFDPEARRRRVVLSDTRSGTHYLVAIGSAETLLTHSHCLHKEHYAKQIREDGKQGLRHLAFAYTKVHYEKPFNIIEHEKKLEFLGFVTLVDPLRPSTKQTIEQAQHLGISIKILTGDSREVAEYVGREIGLLKEGNLVLTGEELDDMTPSQLRHILPQVAIFAKVTPAQKYGIIKILQETSVVGYQGDGINDAPSLKLADVAIAVNNATDVAKENADILLLKPDLSVLINGIRYGRAIFVNINKYIKYTMIGNFGNFFALSGLFLISTTLPLLPVQLLLTSLLTDVPLVAIASDSVNDDEVLTPSKYDIHRLLFLSLVLGTLTMVVEFIFFSLIKLDASSATQTILFLFLTFMQLAVIISVRTRGFFWTGKSPSIQLIAGITIIAVLALVMPSLPTFDALFSFIPLSISSIGKVVLITGLYVGLLDLVKVGYYQVMSNNSLKGSIGFAGKL